MEFARFVDFFRGGERSLRDGGRRGKRFENVHLEAPIFALETQF
ncbi:hypothetical protein EKH55_3970 [Sinorhizobium alkalisoli]|nr:hypothetical protein EKH55_3970 [Sinorhizobium alkalisoli]